MPTVKKTKKRRTILMISLTAVGAANNGKITVKVMNHKDFYGWQDHHAVNKLKKPDGSKHYIADMVYIIAERGSNIIKYKTVHGHDDDLLQELDFLKK